VSFDADNDGGLQFYDEVAAEADYRAWIDEMESFARHEQFIKEQLSGVEYDGQD